MGALERPFEAGLIVHIGRHHFGAEPWQTAWAFSESGSRVMARARKRPPGVAQNRAHQSPALRAGSANTAMIFFSGITLLLLSGRSWYQYRALLGRSEWLPGLTSQLDPVWKRLSLPHNDSGLCFQDETGAVSRIVIELGNVR